MNSDYEKGYQAGYEACVQLYKKRDLALLKDRHVFERSYYLYRSDFMSNFNSTDRELRTFIDLRTFKKNVKTPRKGIEILNLGDWYLVHETGLIFKLDDETSELGIEERITDYISSYYKKMFLNSGS